MKQIFRKFLLWGLGVNETKGPKVSNPIEIASDGMEAQAKIRFGIIKAMNGSLIEVATYKHNPHGPDWKHEVYIVRENETLSDAIKVILATKALEQ